MLLASFAQLILALLRISRDYWDNMHYINVNKTEKNRIVLVES